MKTPDKIFLPRNIDWTSAAILTLGNQPNDVEYISKEALLEWAKERYKTIENDNQLGELFKQGVLYELHRVIAKIESL